MANARPPFQIHVGEPNTLSITTLSFNIQGQFLAVFRKTRIKSTDSKIGLKFLEYDSDEENSPPLQSQTGEDEPKPEEEGIGDMDQNPSNQEKENNSDQEEEENKKHGNNNLHCAYCGLSNEAHLAQCFECKKWFCNGKLDNFSPSHIIFHLTKSKHKEVYLSQSSSFLYKKLYNHNTYLEFLSYAI